MLYLLKLGGNTKKSMIHSDPNPKQFFNLVLITSLNNSDLIKYIKNIMMNFDKIK
jgi:hypothetical protein